MLELDAYWGDIDEQMNRENHKEKWTKMIEHLGEKIPP
jgi:hypothetical protein